MVLSGRGMRDYADQDVGFVLHRVRWWGRLDRRFGVGGRTDAEGAATSVAIGADGGIVVGIDGFRDQGSIMHFDRNGIPERAFGTQAVATPSPSFGAPIAVYVDRIGRIVAVDRSLTAVRLQADGSLDPTFGSGGVATQDVGTVEWKAAAFEADGTLMAAGFDTVVSDSVVGRVLPDWSLDPMFGSGGTVRVSGRAYVYRLALRPEGGAIVSAFAEYFFAQRSSGHQRLHNATTVLASSRVRRVGQAERARHDRDKPGDCGCRDA